MKKLIFLVVELIILAQPIEYAEAGQWCVTSNCPACARHGFGSGDATECFGDKGSCESRVAEVKRSRSTSASMTFSACTEQGGDAASAGSSGDLVTDSTKNVVQGMMNGNSQQTGIGMMGIGAAMLIQGMQGDPAADARKAQEAAAAAEQQRREGEQYRAQEMRHQEIAKQRILGMLKGTEQSSDLSLKTGDDEPPLTDMGTGTKFFGLGRSPSQDTSTLQLKLGDDADASIKVDPRAVSTSGAGLSSGPADTPPSPNTVTNTKTFSPITHQDPELKLKLGDDAPGLPLNKPVALIPRQGDPEHLASGSPIAAGRPAICDGLSQQLDEAYQLARLSLLASDVYDRYDYESKKFRLPATVAADRISDKTSDGERAEMRELFPGMSGEAITDLLQPKDSDYRAAIYEDYVLGRDGKHLYMKKLVLVYRGTSTLGDVKNGDISQAAGLGSDYYTKAIKLAGILKKSADANRYQLELVGHSMGGGMADAAGLANKIKTTTFNPSGVHPNSVPGADMANAQLYLTDYVVDGEPLNWHQDHPWVVKAELYTGAYVAAFGAVAAAPLGGIPSVQIDTTTRDELGTLFSTPLPVAIGHRVTLTPDPADIHTRDVFLLHKMSSVLDAVVARSRELHSQYVYNECGS